MHIWIPLRLSFYISETKGLYIMLWHKLEQCREKKGGLAQPQMHC